MGYLYAACVAFVYRGLCCAHAAFQFSYACFEGGAGDVWVVGFGDGFFAAACDVDAFALVVRFAVLEGAFAGLDEGEVVLAGAYEGVDAEFVAGGCEGVVELFADEEEALVVFVEVGEGGGVVGFGDVVVVDCFDAVFDEACWVGEGALVFLDGVRDFVLELH